LAATIEVLIDRGYNGLTTKEVAVRAGFSNGALVHHYGTKAELVIAATARVYERCIESGKKIASSEKAKRHPVRAYIDDCLNVYLGWPFIAAVEVMLPARNDETLMVHVYDVMLHYRQTMNKIWQVAFEQAGISRDDAPFILMTTLNLVRGMGINSMWQRNVSYYRKLLREWVTLVESGALEGRHCDLR
jgi:AcrR family transcriptional regulator